jgi:hypothetical protein
VTYRSAKLHHSRRDVGSTQINERTASRDLEVIGKVNRRAAMIEGKNKLAESLVHV